MLAKKKKILIHSIAFSPDGVSTAYLYNDIARGFQQEGYEVVVLTTTPHYNVLQEELDKQPMCKRWMGLLYESDFHGIKVLHVPQKKYKSTLLRIVGFVFWHIMSFVLGLREKHVSAIISPSPPLTIGFINILIAKIKGAKVVYNVQEIYPDFLIEQGGLKSALIIRVLKGLERFVYNKSDAVTTIDEIFYQTIVSRFDDQSKLHIVPNFVDTQLYRPLSVEDLDLDKAIFKQNDHIKLMYAGNIGHAQDWEPLLMLAEQLKEESFDFYVIGEGVMKSYVEMKVAELGLSNVFVLPYQPRQLMPQLLAFADLQYIFMSKEMEGHGFPSKVYTIMACAKPLLVCSGDSTPIVNFLKPIACSLLVTTLDTNDKVRIMADFLRKQSKSSLKDLGENGLQEIQSTYTKEIVVNKYIAIIHDLLK